MFGELLLQHFMGLGLRMVQLLLQPRKVKSNNIGIEYNSSIAVSAIDKSTFVTYQKEYGQGQGYVYGFAEIRDLKIITVREWLLPGRCFLWCKI